MKFNRKSKEKWRSFFAKNQEVRNEVREAKKTIKKGTRLVAEGKTDKGYDERKYTKVHIIYRRLVLRII